MNKKYDIVLHAKYGLAGLTQEDMMTIFDKLVTGQGYPMEIELPTGDSSAMGFISPIAAEKLDYEYCGVDSKIGRYFLTNYNEKTEEYTFEGLSIFVKRE